MNKYLDKIDKDILLCVDMIFIITEETNKELYYSYVPFNMISNLYLSKKTILYGEMTRSIQEDCAEKSAKHIFAEAAGCCINGLMSGRFLFLMKTMPTELQCINITSETHF